MSLRNLLALLILLSVAALAVVLFFNLPEKKTETLLDVLPKQVDLALETVHYTQTEGGRRRWTLDADSAEYQREAGLASLQNVEIILFDAGRFTEVKMTASEGRFNQQQGWVDIWGNVEIVTDRGDHFYTERLRYDQNSRQVSSDEVVRVVSPQLELSGKGLRLNFPTGQMSILQDVRAQYKPESKEGSVK